MKYAILFSLLLISCKVVSAEAPHEATVSGYPTAEFAVKGTVEDQLRQEVVPAISKDLAEIRGGKMGIVIIGSADRAGTSAENDNLARKRAEEVGAFLREQFRDADIITRTKGDEMNSKMVLVKWTISAPASMARTEVPGLGIRFWAPVIGVIFAAIMVALVGMRLARKEPQQEQGVPQSASEAKEKRVVVPYGEWVYSVLITHDGEDWHTPFPTLRNPQAHVFRKKREDAEDEVEKRITLADPRFRQMRDDLVARGVIKREKQTKKEVTVCNDRQNRQVLSQHAS